MPQNPRYNLRDSSGNLLGTLYATTNGEIAIHHAGSTEEVVLGSGGISVSSVTSDSVDATSASVSNAPSVAADVARLSEIDDLDAAKADQDGGGVETIENYDLMDTEFATHSNTIDSDHTIPAGKGSVIAGSLSGTGSVSGDGALAVIDEGIHNAVKNPIEETVDADGNDITNAGAVDSTSVETGQLTHGADLTEDFGEITISPGVSDVGSAVMAAIDNLTPEGGTIRLPNVEGLTTQTTIDLSQGVAGQAQETPIRIIGPSAATNGKSGSAYIDGSGLSGPFIQKDNSGRGYVTLENLAVRFVPDTEIVYDIGSAGSFGNHWVLRNLHTADGGDYGFYLADMYGSLIEKINASQTKRGIFLDKMNAAQMDTVVSKNTQPDDGVHPAIRIHEGFGMTLSNFYAEENDGKALSVTGQSRGWTLNGLYLERNGQSTTPASEIVFGDTSLDTGVPNHIGISGSYQTAFQGGSDHILLDDANNVMFENLRGSPQNVATTGTRGDQCLFQNCQLGDIDTAGSTGPSTWIQNVVLGTINRHTDATVVSGD